MKLAPMITARRPLRARAISSRLSASERSIRTCGASRRHLQPDRFRAGRQQQLIEGKALPAREHYATRR